MDREQFDNYIEQEFTEGLPFEPTPEPVQQAPVPLPQMPPAPKQEVQVPFSHACWLAFGAALVGIGLGYWLYEYEFYHDGGG